MTLPKTLTVTDNGIRLIVPELWALLDQPVLWAQQVQPVLPDPPEFTAGT